MPRGRLRSPLLKSNQMIRENSCAVPRRRGNRAAFGAIAVAVLLGLIYPLLGASMLLALLVDAVVPQRWHERFGL